MAQGSPGQSTLGRGPASAKALEGEHAWGLETGSEAGKGWSALRGKDGRTQTAGHRQQCVRKVFASTDGEQCERPLSPGLLEKSESQKNTPALVCSGNERLTAKNLPSPYNLDTARG